MKTNNYRRSGKLTSFLRVLFLAAALSMLLTGVLPANTVQAADSTKKGYVTQSVYLRRSASSTGKTKVKLSAKDTVVIKDCKGIFYYVTATHKKKTYSGYIQKKYVKLTSGSTADEPELICYLTYDDGPGKNTDRLLQILAQNDVKATFFVTGHILKNQANIGKVYRAGHAVGVHSYSHNWDIYKSTKAFYADIDKMAEIVYQQTGEYTHLFRFPGGSSNTVSRKRCKGIMTKLTKDIAKHGYTYFDWNVSSGDAGGTGTTRKKVYNNVIKGMEGKNVCIVLMHDRNLHSVEATADIIKWGKANGYTFKALDTTSFTAHHHINN